jgi:hypothetical protein
MQRLTRFLDWSRGRALDDRAAERIAAASRVPPPSDRDLAAARQRLRAGLRTGQRGARPSEVSRRS